MTTASARLAGLPARLRARAAAASLTVPPSLSGAPVAAALAPPVCDNCQTGVTVDDEVWCEPCSDAPHEFQRDPDCRHGFCLCGRIEHIGFYSPVHLGYNDDRD